MKLVQEKIYDHGIEYIDPSLCGSSIGFRLSRSRYGGLNGQVQLADCGRKVSWEFDGQEQHTYKANLAKIDKAINILQRFRRAYVSAFAAHEEWTKARKSKKKARARKVG